MNLPMWQYQDVYHRLEMPSDLLEFAQSYLSKFKIIANAVEKCVNNEISQLFQEEKEVDAEMLVSSEEQMMSYYKELLDLKTTLQFVDAIDSYRPVVEEMGNVIESICKGFDTLFEKLDVVKRQLEDLASGEIEEEGLDIDLHVSFDIEIDCFVEMIRKAIR